MKQKKNYFGLEIFAVIALIFASTIIKAIYLNQHYLEFSFGNNLTDAAMLYGQNSSSAAIYGTRFVYEMILGVFFSFVGNKAIMAVAFQIGMQALALFMLYVAIKWLIGRKGAITALIMLAFIPYVTEASTEQFLLVLFSLYFLFGAILWKKTEAETGMTKYLYVIFLAFVLATFSYFDIIGFLFSLVFALAVLLAAKENKLITLLFYFIGSVFGYAGMILFKFIPDITQYMGAYFGKIQYQVDFLTKLQLQSNVLAVIAVLAIVAFLLWIIGLIKGNTKAGSIISLFMICLISMKFLAIGSNEYIPIIVISMVFLLANGLQAMMTARTSTEEISEVEMDKEVQEEPVQRPIVSPIEKPKIQYIENPLPVPKRHVARELKYAFEPDEVQLKFDIDDISGKDDFDI